MGEHNNIIIELENGDTLEYSVLAIFELGGRSYVALLPTEESGTDEIVFYGCNENVNSKELELIVIEDDEEFAVVSEAFIKLMDEYADTKGV